MPVNVTIKKNTELVWASVFVGYLNEEFGFDYTVEPDYEEKSMVDMRAVSISGNHPTLDMQLTFAVEMPFIAFEPTDHDYTKKPTQEAIDRKLAKCEARGIDCKYLILIVQGYMNRAHAKQAFADSSFKKYAHYPFRGIYYVSPPMKSGETFESLQEGMVVPIKKAFGK
jgi:hypothetical protein